MVIGVDFDNTIVCWDRAFHETAVSQGLIPADVPVSKEKVRDHLRATGREQVWIELQGYVYGVKASAAPLFPGVREFFAVAQQAHIRLLVISHKTRHPFMGPKYDLHAAGRECLIRNGLHEPGRIGLPSDAVFFELTKAEKMARISAEGCTHFIDDLPEFLTEPGFPQAVERVLFDPYSYHRDAAAYRRVTSWSDLQRVLLEPDTLLRPSMAD